MKPNVVLSPWALGLCVPLLTTALGAAFIEVFVLRPEVAAPWATAADLVPVEARGARLVLILIDGMNAERAFDPGSMPFLASQRQHGAWGIAQAQIPTLTGSAVTTLGTGRWTTLWDAIYNFQSPPSPSDSLFRRLDMAGKRAALIGDGAWASRFGPWADVLAAFPDHGIADTHRSDNASTAAFEAWLAQPTRHPMVVMHWVGADHAGHAGGTRDGSPYTQRLRELDAELGRLCAKLGPDTAVLVISDHGMTPSGGHGGGEQETRDAPFIWWGPGVQVVGPLSLTQAAIAPTVAAYFGVPSPAEAAEPPAAQALALDPHEAEALRRNWERQRAAVTMGDPNPSRSGRAWVIAGIGLALVGLVGWGLMAGAGLGMLGAGVPLLRWWDGGEALVYGFVGIGVGFWALRGRFLGGEASAAIFPRAGARSDWVLGGLLVGCGIAQWLYPQPLTVWALLVHGLGVVYFAYRCWTFGVFGGLTLLCCALHHATPLAPLLALVALAWVVASAAPAPTARRLLFLPPALIAWEVAVYYALGKDYSLSAVQVALAFTLDTELNLAQAVGMVALGEWLPWGIGVVAAGHWLSKTPSLWGLGMTALGLMFPLQIALLVAGFGWIERSFWFLSSTVPFMIGLWIVSVGWPLGFGLAARLRSVPQAANEPSTNR